MVGVDLAIRTGRPLLAVTALIGAAPASFPAVRGFTVGVLVIFADIPSVIIKSSLMSARGVLFNGRPGDSTLADVNLFLSMIFSSLNIIIRPLSLMFCMRRSAEISPGA
jgi:hypothetical protein